MVNGYSNDDDDLHTELTAIAMTKSIPNYGSPVSNGEGFDSVDGRSSLPYIYMLWLFHEEVM
jgi:hypothetical protein